MLATVYALALASILVTRILKAFTLAEALAVAAFILGVLLLWRHRRQRPSMRLALPERLIVIGSLVGLAGLPLKLLFTLLDIGAPVHDMADHANTAGNPVLLHIHHLFFNLGFLVLLISAIAWIAAAIRNGNKPAA
jgi:amino acid transporter